MIRKRAIVILAGGFSRGGKLGWRSSVFGEKADASISGSYIRILAAAYLWRRDPSVTVVTSGGKGEVKNLSLGVFLSTIMKHELIELGVPESVILEENRSNNTYQQLRAIAEMVERHHWSEVRIISNRFHLPRIQAMIECLSGMERLKDISQYVSAEEVMLAEEPEKWQSQIDAAYASSEFAEIIANEKRGTDQIRFSEYRIG